MSVQRRMITAGARVIFGLGRSARVSPDPDRLWRKLHADGDPVLHATEAAAVLAAGLRELVKQAHADDREHLTTTVLSNLADAIERESPFPLEEADRA